MQNTQELSDSLSNVQRVLGNSLLAIWSADVRDAGQYICVVENQAGTTHRRYNVVLQGETVDEIVAKIIPEVDNHNEAFFDIKRV